MSRGDLPVAAAVALLGAVLALHPVVTPDLWWHLASGRWIAAHGAVPRLDPFTYPSATHPWINLQWLGDLATYGLYRRAGVDGLVLLKSFAFAGLGLALYGLGRRAGAGAGAAGGAVTLALLASAERTMVRPEVASFLLLAAVLGCVPLARTGSRAPLALLPLLSAAWANLHSLAFLAPLTVAMHALLTPRGEARARRTLWTGAGLAALALLANPYGLAAWTFPLTLLERIRGGQGAFARILEFARPLDDPGDAPLRFFWAMLAALIVSAALGGGRDRMRSLAGVAPFLLLALMARRNVPLFAIAAAPVLAAYLARAAARFRTPGAPLAAVVPPLLAAGLVLAGASSWLLGLHRERGLGLQPGLFPERCVAAMETLAAPDPLFNDIDFGGYVAWRAPERRTFVDGRLEVAGAGHLDEYLRAHASPAEWERVRRKWGFRTLLLAHGDGGSMALLGWLAASGEWRLACASPEAALLVAAGEGGGAGATEEPPSSPPDAATWDGILSPARPPAPDAGAALAFVADPLHALVAPRVSPARLHRASALAALCLEVGWIDAAREGYRRVLAVTPDDPLALFNLGICEARAGNAGAARRIWSDALGRVPKSRRTMFEDALRRLDAAAPGR